MAGIRPVRRALISVSDKSGLENFAKGLAANGATLISTGGTSKVLKTAGLDIADVSEITGFPEMMGGRVKTLHPKIHGGLLALRDEKDHIEAMSDHNIEPIDLIVVNLYPFEETKRAGASFKECIENIDIGGPAMIRAAAKNHDGVTVVTDPADYDWVLEEISARGGLSEEHRKRLAASAFSYTASYDAAISNWLNGEMNIVAPKRFAIGGGLSRTLRYGENPHQSAALYLSGDQRQGAANARQVQGKELSYNNINDTDAAFELIAELDRDLPAVAIIKHANPCGVASAAALCDAYKLALRCDPVSAFGGIVAVNKSLDAATAEQITSVFAEVVIAPGAEQKALEILRSKKNIRVLIADDLPTIEAEGQPLIKPVAGGFLMQSPDMARVKREDLEIVTKRSPTDDEFADMLFAFRVAKHVKSNAIVYAKDHATVGIGAGQMSRLDSSRIAARKAEEAAETAGMKESLAIGSVVASDAFFPFADGLIAAVEAGARAVIQPGGSIRDDEVIAAADAAGIAMVFTNTRHFRH